MSSRRRRLAAAAAATAGLPLLAACATGFQAPTRHAIANLQAASTAVSSTVSVTDAQVFVPGETASAGGFAYLEFVVVNHGNVDDSLQVDSTTVTAVASGGGSATNPTPLAAAITAVGTLVVPRGTQAAPGVARITLALQALQAPLNAGQIVQVSLDFARSGQVQGLLVPVLGSVDAGTFLPSTPPSTPSPSATTPSFTPSPSTPAASSPASASSSAAVG